MEVCFSFSPKCWNENEKLQYSSEIYSFMVIKSLKYWFLNYYWHTPQNLSPVKVFRVEDLLIFNIQTSKNVHISQYVFWSMFIKKKFILMFQKLNTFLTKQYACEWYSLQYTKQVFIKNRINCSVIRKWCCKHYTS